MSESQRRYLTYNGDVREGLRDRVQDARGDFWKVITTDFDGTKTRVGFIKEEESNE